MKATTCTVSSKRHYFKKKKKKLHTCCWHITVAEFVLTSIRKKA